MARESNKARPRNEYRTDPDKFENPERLKFEERAKAGATPIKDVVKSVVDAVIGAGNSVVSLAAGLLAVSLVVYSGYVIYDSVKVQTEPYFTAWDLLDYKPEYINDNETPLTANDLQDINDDYRAWLTIYDTTIDYPVMQGDDDLYYALHDIYGNTRLTGSIYLAAENTGDFSDSYNLVYGHHMDTVSMADRAMFGTLDYYREAPYFNAHRSGIIVTNSGAYDLTVFAVADTDAYESAIYNVRGNSAEAVKAFLTTDRTGDPEAKTTVHQYDEEVAAGATRIIALSTCADADTSGRLVVFARMDKRDMITVEADGYTGLYDGKPHTPTHTVIDEDGNEQTVPGAYSKVPGAKIEYSTDDGKTWSEEIPSITDAGSMVVWVRASSDTNGTAIDKVTLTVEPRNVTVTANDNSKTYKDDDPELTATIGGDGMVPGEELDYKVTRDEGEDAGKYNINVTGDASQNNGNYIVTYNPATFEIKKATGLTVNVTGYTGTYDGSAHSATATAALPDGTTPEGTTFEYSEDGGKTWKDGLPSIRDVGGRTYLVRAVNDNYEPSEPVSVTLQINARPTGGGGGGGTNPTPDNPTPDNPAETISVTIRKEWRNDSEATRPASVRMVLTVGDSSQVVTLSASNGWTETVDGIPAGTNYAWSEPNVPGYRQSSQTGANNVTTVVNTWSGQQPGTDSHNLTIRYRYQDGTEAASPYRTSVAEGSRYDIASPQIDGYVPTQARVSGTMPGRELEITVVYVPAENQDELTVIDDYGTPLGVNKVFIATGDCFE